MSAFLSRKQRGDDDYGPSYGRQIDSTDRPLAYIDAQRMATPERLEHARGWFREIDFDELEPLGTLGKRWLFEGRELRAEESYDVELNPGATEVEMFCVDPAGMLLYLRAPRPLNTARSLTDAVIAREVRIGEPAPRSIW